MRGKQQSKVKRTLRRKPNEAKRNARNPKCVSGVKQNLNVRREVWRETGEKPDMPSSVEMESHAEPPNRCENSEEGGRSPKYGERERGPEKLEGEGKNAEAQAEARNQETF